MATVPIDIDNPDRVNAGANDYRIVTWANMENLDDGEPLELIGHPDRSVQVVGTFGAGGTLTIEGSNDGAAYAVLTDPQGEELNLVANDIAMISEVPRFLRPRVSAGDGTTDLTVILLARRSK